MPKIQWDPHCPYGNEAMGNLYIFHPRSYLRSESSRLLSFVDINTSVHLLYISGNFILRSLMTWITGIELFTPLSLRVSVVHCCQLLQLFLFFSKGGIWDMIVSVLDLFIPSPNTKHQTCCSPKFKMVFKYSKFDSLIDLTYSQIAYI